MTSHSLINSSGICVIFMLVVPPADRAIEKAEDCEMQLNGYIVSEISVVNNSVGKP